jgi:hypothetical protein
MSAPFWISSDILKTSSAIKEKNLKSYTLCISAFFCNIWRQKIKILEFSIPIISYLLTDAQWRRNFFFTVCLFFLLNILQQHYTSSTSSAILLQLFIILLLYLCIWCSQWPGNNHIQLWPSDGFFFLYNTQYSFNNAVSLFEKRSQRKNVRALCAVVLVVFK